jgi:hypothetical protein
MVGRRLETAHALEHRDEVRDAPSPNERVLADPPGLEGASIEQPDRERTHCDDAEKDQRERDIRGALGIVLRKAIQPLSLVLPSGRHPDLKGAIHQTEFWRKSFEKASDPGQAGENRSGPARRRWP